MKLKALAITTALFISGLAQAGDIIAKYEFSQNKYQEGLTYMITAEVDLDQGLSVKVNKILNDYSRIPGPQDVEAGLEKEYKLSDIEFNILKRRIDHFHDVKIVRNTNRVICMIMPHPTMYFNTLSLNPTSYTIGGPTRSALEVVLGPTGCWVRNSITPEKSVDIERASTLKDLIKLITLNKIENDL